LRLAGRCRHGIAQDQECPECEIEFTEREKEREGQAERYGARPVDRHRKADNEWWSSSSGKAVKQWFEAWGRVIHERQVTGDPSAMPTMDGIGTGRGNPSDVSNLLLYYSEVDTYLAKTRSARHRELMSFIYADSIDDVILRTLYVFGDGTQVVLGRSEPPPQAYERCQHETKIVRFYDLFQFAAPEVEALCAAWWPHVTKERFLELEHLRLAKGFAEVTQL
jgi:hypothetical protein